ncbi:MAG: lysylphosphatidylglycerol synthase transmembrane domain-containing protein [Candidatus Omnitrophica bacterium]|nr:lysylphosphatidylglycerol synthase transmembrane domain-containing protein [Candidatus Omnitrophota bacterium]
MKAKLISIARFLVSFLVIWVLVFIYRDKWREVLGHLSSLNLWLLIFSILIYFVTIFVVSIRMQILLAVQKIKISIMRSCHLNIIGQFFNIFLPSAVGGDVVKAYYAYKESGDKLASFTSVVFDRFLGFFAIMCMACGALACYWNQLNRRSVRTTILVMSAVFIGLALIMASKRIATRFGIFGFLIPESMREKLSNLYFAFHNYRHHTGSLIAAVAFSFLAQFLGILLNYLLARCVGIDIPLGIYFLIVPVVAVMSMVPSVNGLGVREASMVYFFGGYTTSDKALAFALVYDVALYAVSFICGIFYAFLGGSSKFKGIKDAVSL